MTAYRHTQTGTVLLYLLVGLASVFIALALITPGERIAIVVPTIVLLVAASLFGKLTITVDDKILRASFGPGLIYKQVPVRDVVRCESMRVRWWHGWGIHLTGNGWLYNVSGRDAVIIILRNGRRFCIGTDEPQELQAAIRRFASAR